MPKESDFQLTESPMPHPAGGEVLVRELYLSVDPSTRGRLSGLATFAKSVHTGEVIVGGAVGQVVESNDPRFAPGDIAEGMLGWQEYAVASAKTLRKVDGGCNPSLPRSTCWVCPDSPPISGCWISATRNPVRP